MLSMLHLAMPAIAASKELDDLKKDKSKTNDLVKRAEEAFGHIKIDPDKDPNPDDFNKFVEALTPELVTEMEKELPKTANFGALMALEVTNQIRANKASKDLQDSVHADVDGDPKALNDLSVKALESILTKRPDPKNSKKKTILEAKGTDPLFKAEDLNTYFEEAKLVDKLQNVHLDLSLSSKNKEKSCPSGK